MHTFVERFGFPHYPPSSSPSPTRPSQHSCRTADARLRLTCRPLWHKQSRMWGMPLRPIALHFVLRRRCRKLSRWLHPSLSEVDTVALATTSLALQQTLDRHPSVFLQTHSVLLSTSTTTSTPSSPCHLHRNNSILSPQLGVLRCWKLFKSSSSLQ